MYINSIHPITPKRINDVSKRGFDARLNVWVRLLNVWNDQRVLLPIDPTIPESIKEFVDPLTLEQTIFYEKTARKAKNQLRHPFLRFFNKENVDKPQFLKIKLTIPTDFNRLTEIKQQELIEINKIRLDHLIRALGARRKKLNIEIKNYYLLNVKTNRKLLMKQNQEYLSEIKNQKPEEKE